MQEELKTLIGQATPEQIALWKKEYGDIFVAKSDEHIAYFKKPERQLLGYVMALNNNPLKQSDTLLQGCFIGGSKTILTDTDHFLGLSALMDNLLIAKKVEVEKL